MQFSYFYWNTNEKKADDSYFTMESAMTAILRDASGKMYHGIPFDRRLGHVSHSTELVRMCLACQHFEFNSAEWISDNLHVISS